MSKFTFFELHLDDATITNNAPYSGADANDEDIEAPEEGEGGGRSILGLVALSLVVAIGATLAARALLGEDEPIEELIDEAEQ